MASLLSKQHKGPAPHGAGPGFHQVLLTMDRCQPTGRSQAFHMAMSPIFMSILVTSTGPTLAAR